MCMLYVVCGWCVVCVCGMCMRCIWCGMWRMCMWCVVCVVCACVYSIPSHSLCPLLVGCVCALRPAGTTHTSPSRSCQTPFPSPTIHSSQRRRMAQLRFSSHKSSVTHRAGRELPLGLRSISDRVGRGQGPQSHAVPHEQPSGAARSRSASPPEEGSMVTQAAISVSVLLTLGPRATQCVATTVSLVAIKARTLSLEGI